MVHQLVVQPVRLDDQPDQTRIRFGGCVVGIDAIEPVGHYAVQPRFSDGHDSGIFTWELLYRLGAEEAEHWARYEKRLKEAGV